MSQPKKEPRSWEHIHVTEYPIGSQTKLDHLGIVVVAKKHQLPAPIAKAGLKSFLLEVDVDGDPIVFSLAETFFLSFYFVDSERTLFTAWYAICSPNSRI
jgi:hypothetical protein